MTIDRYNQLKYHPEFEELVSLALDGKIAGILGSYLTTDGQVFSIGAGPCGTSKLLAAPAAAIAKVASECKEGVLNGVPYVGRN